MTKLEKAQSLLDIQCSKGNYDVNEYMRGMANGMKVLMAVFDDKEPEFIDKPDNLVPEALNILRQAMEDKSEGELYHGWVCNIKWIVYDTIKQNNLLMNTEEDLTLQEACKTGAKTFLNRLLKEEK